MSAPRAAVRPNLAGVRVTPRPRKAAPVAEVKSARMGADMDAHDGPDEVRETSRAPGLGDPSFGDGRPPADPDWRDLAVCADRDPEIWFPGVGDRPGRELAKAYCRACPAIEACLAEAMRLEAGRCAEQRHGIFGGLTAPERAALDKARRPRLVDHCPWPGWTRGLERHADLDEPPCRRCTELADRLSSLSVRDERVVRLRASGMPLHQIATVVQATTRTVRAILARHQDLEQPAC